MTPIVAALKRQVGRQLAQNLLSQFNGQSQPIEVRGAGALGFYLRFSIVPHIPPCTIDIKDDGTISAYFVSELYAEHIECSINVNQIIRAGTPLVSVCLVPIPFDGCAVSWDLKMPYIGRVGVEFDTSEVGLDRVPLAAFDSYFAVKDIHDGDPDGDDKRELKADLVPDSVFIRPNDLIFVRMLVDAITNFVDNKLAQIPIIGTILSYLPNFLDTIADGILNTLGAQQAWLDFVSGEVQQAALSNFNKIWDPTIPVKVGNIPSRVQIAGPFTAAGGQQQSPIYIDFHPISIDVNTDCPAGPELRAQVTAN
jgi:hypothetical protein